MKRFTAVHRPPGTGPVRAEPSRRARRPAACALAALVAAAALVTVPVTATAQDPAASEPAALEAVLFPPELIMQHRRAIGLTDEQRESISGMIQELQGRILALQWELLEETQALNEILEQPRVDLDRALDRLDAVLDSERQIKEAHLELLIRIKNLLEPGQVEALQRLRREG